jgi:hypothetical protein
VVRENSVIATIKTLNFNIAGWRLEPRLILVEMGKRCAVAVKLLLGN